MKLSGSVLSCIFAGLVFGGAASAQSMSCNTSVAAPAALRYEGNAELVSDIVLNCTGGSAGTVHVVNVAVFLSTNVTSNLTGPGADETEALLLVDDPLPAPAANVSNGFAFTGQVKGTAGLPASGNVFTGARTGSVNQMVFLGVPVVAPGAGTRRLRITNLRAVPVIGAAPVPVLAFLSASGPAVFSILNPVQTVGLPANGLLFTSVPVGTSLRLTFTETFASSFKKRIENTPAGALVPALQNQPGAFYCTESGFTPDFGGTAPGAPGSANQGTRLRAVISNLSPFIPGVVVPNRVVSSGGSLVAARVVGGVPTTAGGSVVLPIISGSASVTYEVVAVAPFAGVNGCAVTDSFVINASPWLFGTLANAVGTGRFAPQDPTVVISGPAPEPRFR